MNYLCYIYKGRVLLHLAHEEGRSLRLNASGNNGGGPSHGHVHSFRHEYNLRDHLGNLRVSFTDADQDGKPEITQEQHYEAYGLRLGGLTYMGGEEERYLYNGIERIGELGLGWYQAFYRGYNPTLGRWMQTDPKYNYSESVYAGFGNNPVRYSDVLGDSIITNFEYREGVQYDKYNVPTDIQNMFNQEFGITVGYNKISGLLYYVSDYQSNLSQSPSATNELKRRLQSTKNTHKNGKIEFVNNWSNVYTGAWLGGITYIDMGDFNSDGSPKGNYLYVGVEKRNANLARIFEHEYLGHELLNIGGMGDGTRNRMGKVVKYCNQYLRERGLLELLNYGDGEVNRYYGNTSDFKNDKEILDRVKKYINGEIVSPHYIQDIPIK